VRDGAAQVVKVVPSFSWFAGDACNSANTSMHGCSGQWLGPVGEAFANLDVAQQLQIREASVAVSKAETFTCQIRGT
jgi:hypothetical protein